MPAKLKFRVVHCSSEDPEFPSTELNAHSPHTVGWQSSRFCDYPQEIGFQFAGPVHLMQLQVPTPHSKPLCVNACRQMCENAMHSQDSRASAHPILGCRGALSRVHIVHCMGGIVHLYWAHGTSGETSLVQEGLPIAPCTRMRRHWRLIRWSFYV